MMRIVVLRTRGSNCAPIYEPLSGLGHEVHSIVYDAMAADAHQSLPTIIEDLNPDWVLMFGTSVVSGIPIIPSIEVLGNISRKYPFVHLCCDGADAIWWPQLQDYYDHDVFALQVNIDGVKAGPIGERGMTALTPLDAATYPDPPVRWENRNVRLGFCGGYGGPQPRTYAIAELVDNHVLTVRKRDSSDNFDGYRNFMLSCKCIWNHAVTGTGDRMHVKGRVIETALAGAVLFETRGSPTFNWFVPGEDYISCAGYGEVKLYLDWIDRHPDYAQKMANNLRRKVIERHSAPVFWKQVMERIGLQ